MPRLGDLRSCNYSKKKKDLENLNFDKKMNERKEDVWLDNMEKQREEFDKLKLEFFAKLGIQK